MSLRASRRRALPGAVGRAGLTLALSFALFFGPASPFGGASADGGPAEPSAQAPLVAQARPRSIEVDRIEVHQGQFESDGKPVEDFYCAPLAPRAHPAVILLHGAVPRGSADADFTETCRKLAAAGYYAMFVEYYSQAGPARPGDPPVLGKGFAAWVDRNFPTWTREIVSAIDVLGSNPAVERDRIALIGHSLGGFLALAVGASQGGRVAAIVEYYGAMNNGYRPTAANMPPTLILHGSADRVIPVHYAYDLDALLTRYDRPHEMKIYPGAWHGLDPATRADAWQRSLDFLRHYLGP
jgi:carboxymethylenebutenolidase